MFKFRFQYTVFGIFDHIFAEKVIIYACGLLSRRAWGALLFNDK